MIPTARSQPSLLSVFDGPDPFARSAQAVDAGPRPREVTEPAPAEPGAVGEGLEVLLAEWRAADRAMSAAPPDSLERQDRLHDCEQARRRFHERFEALNSR